MLFKRRFLDGIAAGAVTLAFRRWRRPSVRAGGRLRTPVGVVAIEAIEVVELTDIAETDAKQAGFASRDELLTQLDACGEGPVHKVTLRFAGPDPREALRQKSAMTRDELADAGRRLVRLDAASRRGPWTTRVLRLIAERPAVRARELAASLDRDTGSFKADVRKLKELGLTESLEIGYRLSPRGRALLELATPDGAPAQGTTLVSALWSRRPGLVVAAPKR